MRRCDGFIWGPSSAWTNIRPGNCIQRAAHGYSAETTHQTRSETDSDAIASAGHQAAADVHARAVGPAESGDGRKPDVGGGPHRGPPARRGGRGPRKDR